MAVVAASAAAAAAAAAEVTVAAAAAGEGTAPREPPCSEEGREKGRETISQGAGGEGSIFQGGGVGSISQGCFAWLPDPRLLHASLDAAISAHGDAYVQVR